MDGTVEAVLRLDDAKRKALVDFDASAYDDHLRAQLRLLETSTPAAIAAQSSSADILALAKLIRLNSLLYHNPLSISPWIQQPPPLTPPVGTSPLERVRSVSRQRSEPC